MKICHFTSVHKTNDIRIFYKECATLADQANYDVYLVGQGDNVCDAGVKIIGVGDKPRSRLKRMMFFSAKVFKKAVEIDADIYHLHDPELLRYALKLKKIGKIVIFDSHENILDSIDEKTYLPYFFKKIAKLYYKYLQDKVIKKIDGVIIVTPQMAEIYQELNNNIVLIPNYPLLNNRYKTNKDFVKGRFVFAGGVTAQWSHREIITAIENLNVEKIEYRIFGPCDNDYIEELKKMKGWDKINYGGIIPYQDVQEELSRAHCVLALCKPGKNTFFKKGSLGNTKLFEAMGNGRPVIATDFELWKEIIETSNCGICANPNDIKDIEVAISAIMNKTTSEIKSMGDNGESIVKDKYSWQIISNKLIDMYRLLEIRAKQI